MLLSKLISIQNRHIKTYFKAIYYTVILYLPAQSSSTDPSLSSSNDKKNICIIMKTNTFTVRLIFTLTKLFYSILQFFYSILYFLFCIPFYLTCQFPIFSHSVFFFVMYSILFYSILLAFLFYSILLAILFRSILQNPKICEYFLTPSKSKKYQGVFSVKSRVKT